MTAFNPQSKSMRRVALLTLILSFNSLTGVNIWALGLMEQSRTLEQDLMEQIDGAQSDGDNGAARNGLICENRTCGQSTVGQALRSMRVQ